MIRNRLLNCKVAFTLAEVLITLGIIGIVATMTIPILINSYQKTQYVAALKKAVSSWNQALSMMAQDAGCPGDLSCFFDSTDLTVMGDKISQYFGVAKNCKRSTNGCFAASVADNFDGTNLNITYDDTIYYRFITTDGMSINIGALGNNCSQVLNVDPNSYTHRFCSNVFIDVNGPQKGPNFFGRDIFYFMITNGRGPSLYPLGGIDYSWIQGTYCDSGYNGGVNKNGQYCGGRVISQGWTMDY